MGELLAYARRDTVQNNTTMNVNRHRPILPNDFLSVLYVRICSSKYASFGHQINLDAHKWK